MGCLQEEPPPETKGGKPEPSKEDEKREEELKEDAEKEKPNEEQKKDEPNAGNSPFYAFQNYLQGVSIQRDLRGLL